MNYKKIVYALRDCKNNASCDKCMIREPCFAGGNVEDYAANVIEELAAKVYSLEHSGFDPNGKCSSCLYAEKIDSVVMKSYINCRNPILMEKWEKTRDPRNIKQRCSKACSYYKKRESPD